MMWFRGSGNRGLLRWHVSIPWEKEEALHLDSSLPL